MKAQHALAVILRQDAPGLAVVPEQVAAAAIPVKRGVILVCAIPARKKSHGSVDTADGSVNLAGKDIAYSLTRSRKAKNLRIMVGGETGLEVVVPAKFDLDLVEPVLIKKQEWIIGKLDYFKQVKESLHIYRQQSGHKVLYRGREYEVETVVTQRASGTVQVEEGKLLVLVPAEAENDCAAVLEGWYRTMARLLINQRIRVVNQVLNLEFNRVAIRGQKTRWGSCSHLGNLNFNWRLVMAPLPVMDYIVAHELLHLVEANHSKKFWALVENICPDYRACREWLKKNGHRLKIQHC
jgi:predicted metal-dependent hydrolase